MGFFSSMADPFGLFGDGQSGMDVLGLGGGMDMFGLGGGGEGGGSSIFGSKPVVPKFKSTDLEEQQKAAIKGNLKSLGKAKELSNKVNVFNQAQLEAMLKEAIPQYQKMMNAGSARSMDLLDNESFASMLRGEIPQDVQDAVTNSAAARAVGGGYGGSQMHANLVARDFGLTSLDLIKRGSELTTNSVNSAAMWMSNSKALAVPAQHDVSKMFLSGLDYASNDRANQANQWTRNWLAAQVEAAPDPAARGAFDTAMGVAGMVAGIYSGGPGYQNYYKGPNYQGGTPGAAAPAAGGGGGTWQTGAANTSYLPQNDAPTNIDYGQGAPAADDTGSFMSPWF